MNFHLGAIAHRGLGTEVPQWVQKRNPGRGIWRTKSPEAETVLRHCLQLILTAETIKIRNCGVNLHPNFRPVCFAVGAKRHFVGGRLPPKLISVAAIVARSG